MITAALTEIPGAIGDYESVVVRPATQTVSLIKSERRCRCSIDLEPEARARGEEPKSRTPRSRELPTRPQRPPRLEP